jgi:hypothetical protein
VAVETADVAEHRELGDVTTPADPSVVGAVGARPDTTSGEA